MGEAQEVRTPRPPNPSAYPPHPQPGFLGLGWGPTFRLKFLQMPPFAPQLPLGARAAALRGATPPLLAPTMV